MSIPPKVVKSEIKYRGRAFTVRVDEVEFRPGHTTRLDIVDHPNAVTILPLDDAGNVWFIRQYRHSAGETILELPAGTLKLDEDPAYAANRELQEEIGKRAEHMQPLSTFWLAPGYSTELMHVFLATGLSESVLDQDEDEVISVEQVPVRQVLALVDNGTLKDAKSLAAVLVAARKLGWS